MNNNIVRFRLSEKKAASSYGLIIVFLTSAPFRRYYQGQTEKKSSLSGFKGKFKQTWFSGATLELCTNSLYAVMLAELKPP